MRNKSEDVQTIKFMTPKVPKKSRLKTFEYTIEEEQQSEDDYIPIDMINKSFVDSGRK